MTDPGAARGNQTYPAHRKCQCSHSELAHELNEKKVRTRCTHGDWNGPCSCTKFRQEVAVRG